MDQRFANHDCPCRRDQIKVMELKVMGINEDIHKLDVVITTFLKKEELPSSCVHCDFLLHVFSVASFTTHGTKWLDFPLAAKEEMLPRT